MRPTFLDCDSPWIDATLAALSPRQRIAQLLILGVPDLRFAPVDELPPSGDDRGSAGFGSSG